MGRTKLRGIELAGIRIAIEAPSWCDWSWPDALRPCAGLVPNPDIYLALRRADASSPDAGSNPRCHPTGSTCELSRSGDGWAITVHGGGPGPRHARFDAAFRHGEIEMSQQSVAHRSCPIAYPLGEWIIAQRAARNGGLVLWGSVSVRRGRGLVFLGDHAPRDLSSGCRAGWLVLQPHSEGVRVCALASVTGRDGRICAAWVHGIHVADSIVTDGLAPAVLEAEDAATELLRYSFSAVQGVEGADRVLDAASRLAERISVIRTGATGGARFSWQRERSASALDAIGA